MVSSGGRQQTQAHTNPCDPRDKALYMLISWRRACMYQVGATLTPDLRNSGRGPRLPERLALLKRAGLPRAFDRAEGPDRRAYKILTPELTIGAWVLYARRSGPWALSNARGSPALLSRGRRSGGRKPRLRRTRPESRLPLVLTTTVYHWYLPPQLTIGAYHWCLPQELTTGAYHRCLPGGGLFVFIIGAYHEILPWSLSPTRTLPYHNPNEGSENYCWDLTGEIESIFCSQIFQANLKNYSKSISIFDCVYL